MTLRYMLNRFSNKKKKGKMYRVGGKAITTLCAVTQHTTRLCHSCDVIKHLPLRERPANLDEMVMTGEMNKDSD